jgi:hypothetical protein
MSFANDLERFAVNARRNVRAVFVRSTEEVQRSVVLGSEITGAPGQPVDTGNLKTSFVGEFESPTSWAITTNTEYAPFIENGETSRGPITIRSEVGGTHSVGLTRAGWGRIVEAANTAVGGANG